jgi:hypothetical protein
MARFEKDDIVIVRNVIATNRVGQTGRIIEFKPAKRRGPSNLDKYVVLFEDGGQAELWDIQLERPISQQAG